ncbi:MAG: matrixin family metalloprotease [Polyangiaceae bacterium]
MLAPHLLRSTRRFAMGSLVLAALAVGVGAPGEASAYCRSTTCANDCPRDDEGCKTTGKPLFWASRCVGFSVQRDGTENLPMEVVRPVIEGAFLAWTELPCDAGGATASIAFSPLDDVSCREAEYDGGGPNANVVMFQDTKWSYAGAENNLAKTTVTYDAGTGEILDADIELNFAFNELTAGDDHVVYDIGAILTHEIGHFVGLDHSGDPSATMFAEYEPGTTEQRTLELDDVLAVCAAYAPERQAACEPEPKNGLADGCAGDGDAESGGCAMAGEAPRERAGWVYAIAAGAALCAALQGRRRRGRKRGSERSR